MEEQVILTEETLNGLEFLISMSPSEQVKSSDGVILLDRDSESDNDWYYDR